MLKIRLARVGKRGHATFRVVVTEHKRPPKSGALETVGSYDPHTNLVELNTDRIRQYLASGAQLSPTVHNLLVDKHIVSNAKVAARRYPHAAPEATTSSTTPTEATPVDGGKTSSPQA